MKKLLLVLPSALFLTGCVLGKNTAVTPSPQAPTIEKAQSMDSAMPTQTLLADGNAIFIADQSPGKTIHVDLVVLTNPGYVVIHGSGSDGEPGKVIGHSTVLPAQKNENVSAQLIEAVQEGDRLIAMLHTDNGDGEFAFPGADGPIQDSLGNTIMMQFVATSRVEGSL